jgi:hypothetical protein
MGSACSSSSATAVSRVLDVVDHKKTPASPTINDHSLRESHYHAATCAYSELSASLLRFVTLLLNPASGIEICHHLERASNCTPRDMRPSARKLLRLIRWLCRHGVEIYGQLEAVQRGSDSLVNRFYEWSGAYTKIHGMAIEDCWLTFCIIKAMVVVEGRPPEVEKARLVERFLTVDTVPETVLRRSLVVLAVNSDLVFHIISPILAAK